MGVQKLDGLGALTTSVSEPRFRPAGSSDGCELHVPPGLPPSVPFDFPILSFPIFQDVFTASRYAGNTGSMDSSSVETELRSGSWFEARWLRKWCLSLINLAGTAGSMSTKAMGFNLVGVWREPPASWRVAYCSPGDVCNFMYLGIFFALFFEGKMFCLLFCFVKVYFTVSLCKLYFI